jgi:drug/metabolite transporter (DMT)-like permease
VGYLPIAAGEMRRVAWTDVSASAWIGTALAGILGLNVGYLIWYTAVQRIGSARTSAYSNLIPVAAVLVAAVWLGERPGAATLAGAAAVLGGVAVTRWAASASGAGSRPGSVSADGCSPA